MSPISTARTPRLLVRRSPFSRQRTTARCRDQAPGSILKLSLYLCFFLSGTCGLAYEVLWAKYLGLFIGNSTYAHAVVLSAFMGGLALGNYYFGSIADRSRNCLKAYGAIELAIGLYALLTPLILMFGRWVFTLTGSQFGPGS